MTDFKELIAPFQNYFTLQIADAADLRERVFRLRYEVFCQEFGFEDAAKYQDAQEHDEFDHAALHCLVTHKNSGEAAGCVRLVRTLEEPPGALPIKRYARESLTMGSGIPTTQPEEHLLEISRLAISSRFRKRRGEDISPLGINPEFSTEDEVEQRMFPLLSFTLLFTALSASFLQRCDNVAMMEPWLVRHLRLMGLSLRQIGQVVHYHGMRAAFYYPFEQALLDRERQPGLRRLLEDLIDPWVAQEMRRTGQLS